MILNGVEKLLMNNPVRAAIQRRFEAGLLLRMGGSLQGGKALEIGCGRGIGGEIVLTKFGAEKLDAFDLDPDMVRQAHARLSRFGDRAKLWVGDASKIDAPNATYNAVFDFGIVHHVPQWRTALSEVARVLKPGGRFFGEEMLRDYIAYPIWKALLDHPQEDRFDHRQFLAGLQGAGLEVVADRHLGTWAGWYVARKPDAAAPH